VGVSFVLPPWVVSVEIAPKYDVDVIGDVVVGEALGEEVTHFFDCVVVGAVVIDVDQDDLATI